MRLEHQQESRGVRFSPEELEAVMKSAIARHGAAERDADWVMASGATTLEEAVEIGLQLGIPEEHVRAAARESQQNRLRERQVETVLARRKTAFACAAAGLVAGIIAFGLAGQRGAEVWLTALAAMVPVLGVFYWWLRASVSEEEANRVAVIPVAGVCRVCGAEAYSERSTFCEEHRYKGPAGE